MLNEMVVVPLESVVAYCVDTDFWYVFVKVTAVFGTFDVMVAITEEYWADCCFRQAHHAGRRACGWRRRRRREKSGVA